MKRALLPVLTLAALVVPAFSLAGDTTLGPGSMAPEIKHSAWIKGSKVTGFEAGKTYIVEFWATWCGPCIAAFPHLSEIAKKNPDVTIVGMNIWERGQKSVEDIQKFVGEQGPKMGYNVAMDDNKFMEGAWMAAAGQNGIPCAFIVKDKKVMWIGHPMNLDKPLEEIKAGKYDLEAAKKAFAEEAANAAKAAEARKIVVKAQKLIAEGKLNEAEEALAEAQRGGVPAGMLAYPRFQLGMKKDPAAAMKIVDDKVKTPDGANEACGWAMQMAGSDPKTAKAIVGKALKATKEEDFIVLYYGTQVGMMTKDKAEAQRLVAKMEAALPKSQFKDNDQIKKMIADMKGQIDKMPAKP